MEQVARNWAEYLGGNRRGQRTLTLRKAAALLAQGVRIGWYVIEASANHWKIGCDAPDGESIYLLNPDGKPLLFESRDGALDFVGDFLS